MCEFIKNNLPEETHKRVSLKIKDCRLETANIHFAIRKTPLFAEDIKLCDPY